MFSQIPSGVSDSTMHKLTLKQIEAWSDRSAVHKKELTDLMADLVHDLRMSRSPTKVIERTAKRLEKFFSQKEVRGSIVEKNQRRIEFELSFPLKMQGGLGFSMLLAEVNARTGLHQVSETEPVFISTHALQRLLQRIEFKNESVALDEIHSCIRIASYWKQGAIRAKALCWPLLSKSGFFVTSTPTDTDSSSLITWMKGTNLSKKWGLVYDNLINLSENNPSLMVEEWFIEEFLRSFPWMMYEHSPEVDLSTLAWESKYKEEKLNDHDDNSAIANQAENSKVISKSSVSFIPGMNYKNGAPPFKTYSKHNGVVVQKRSSGELVVALLNSWVGQISTISYKKTKRYLPSLNELFVGDKVRVEVRKINFDEDEMAYSVSLDRLELAEFLWKEILTKYPVGAKAKGQIFAKVGQDCAVQIEDGVRGVIPLNHVKLYMTSNNLSPNELIGLNIEFVISDHKATTKNITLEIPDQQIKLAEIMANEFYVNNNIQGRTIWKNDNFAIIELSYGFNAILHLYNCWEKGLPEVGEYVPIKIIDVEPMIQKIRVSLIPSIPMSQIFPAIPFTNERWESFVNLNKIGDKVTVQILKKNETYYVASTSNGDYGSLPFKEISWSRDFDPENSNIKIGDLVEVEIHKCKKNTVIFSKKALEQHPLEKFYADLSFDKKYSGTVLNVVDYGYFIGLDLGFDGLLSKDAVLDSKLLEKGERIDVLIKDVDLVKKRVSFLLN